MSSTAVYPVELAKTKIEQLLKPSEKSSLSWESREMLKLIYKQLDSFDEIAKSTLHTELDISICLETYKLEDIVDEIGSKSESNDWSVENLKQRIDSFTPQLKMEVQSCSDGLYNLDPDEEEEEKDEGDVSSKVIGVPDVYQQLKDTIMKSPVTSLVGMTGIGKTALANKFFKDPELLDYFDHRVWVRVGKKCRLKDIPRRILAKMNANTFPEEGDDEAVHEQLKASLESKAYLIVLDDVWDRFALHLLHPYHRYECEHLNHPFRCSESVSRILLTSRLKQLNNRCSTLDIDDNAVTTRLLNKEESWDLLCDKVFCKGSPCPPHLVKAGKKISENCDGLPLTILTVARLLSEEDTSTLEYWNEIAEKKNHQLFIDAYDEMSKVLLPSYTYLPPLLQMCFLFIGLFPRNHEILRSKLINLWKADGFFELNININDGSNAIDCLEELVSNNVVMVYKMSTYNFDHTVKSCGLHSSLWYMSRPIARETKFAIVLSSINDCFGDGIEGHHRVSFNTNVLFAIKGVNKLLEDNYASTAHSLLCFGPYNHYQVPLCFHLKLLSELDALSIRFYEFPMEVLQLVRLKYLAFTSNGTLPPSISQLSSLQFLIVERHQNIKSCRDQPYLPAEIWSLQDLRHLQVKGSDLPDPCGASLENLSTLSGVSDRSCTEAVLKGIPYLCVLKIQIELAPEDDGRQLSCFTDISCLSMLWSLKCTIVNPKVDPPIVPFSSFPTNYLTNLSLNGLGYPWNEMRKVALLPHLRVLKLKNYAFQGLEWAVEEGEFSTLGSLVIEDTDLVDWKFERGAFNDLKSLIIRSCYKLEKVRGKFCKHLKIELVDCNPSCVGEMKKAMSEFCVLEVHSSWEDRKLQS